MKKKVVEVVVWRYPHGTIEAGFTKLDVEKDEVSVRCYFPTSASIRRIGIAVNRAGGEIYAEASPSAVGFRMVR